MQQKIEHWQSVSRSIIFGLGRLFYHRTAKCKETTKRANPENPVDKNGRMKRKTLWKIHKNRCPGYLQAKAKQLFLNQQVGMYVEVPILYRASQHDHTSDTYIPKKLSQRMYHLTDGTKFKETGIPILLYCINKLIHRSTN